ncbi:MAG: hypothetical protein LKJ69_01700 [Lactobacillus sp.]|nr:hypothetical protein [Lactobacillus sp.]MCI2032098.1 hypothetical protein [Lactobacillus sp.]
MKLSKEQLALLQKLDAGKLPVSNDYFNHHLIDLWHEKLLTPEIKFEGGDETVTGYRLTDKGRNLVSIEKEERSQHVKDNFWSPLAVNFIIWIVGLAMGWILRSLF